MFNGPYNSEYIKCFYVAKTKIKIKAEHLHKLDI